MIFAHFSHFSFAKKTHFGKATAKKFPHIFPKGRENVGLSLKKVWRDCTEHSHASREEWEKTLKRSIGISEELTFFPPLLSLFSNHKNVEKTLARASEKKYPFPLSILQKREQWSALLLKVQTNVIPEWSSL